MDNKKKSGLILMAVSVLMLFLLTNLSYGGKKLNSLLMSGDEIQNLIEGRSDKNFEELTLKLDGNACLKEAESDNFYYSLIDGSKSAFNPVVKLVGRDRSLKVAFDKGISKESIENNEALQMIVYNDRYFHIYRLVATTLPIMNLECKKEISEEDSRMEMTLYDNRSSCASRVVKSDGYVRFRGATTLYYPKKSMKLSLTQQSLGDNRRNNDISLLGLRQDDDWILYAAYNDQEKVRNVFSHNLWEESCATDNAKHVDAGMEYRYLELFVDGRYYGLYALGSPLDEMQFELSGDVKEDALYKSIYWSSLEGIMMPENVVTAFEVKSLPEIVKSGEGSLTENGTVLMKESGATVIDNSAWNLFLDYSFQLNDNRYDSKALMEGIDIDNAIDIYLFFALIQGMDTTAGSRSKNYYFSVSREGDRLKALYAPWDMDISWGNYWTGDIDVNFTIPYGVKAEENYLFEHGYLNQIIVNNDTDIGDRIIEKYRSLRNGAWSTESIMKMLDEYEDDIYSSGAFRRETERWPEGTYNEAKEKLSTFKEYVTKRLEETDAYMERLEADFNKSILVRRSTQYKDFRDCNFFIAVSDPEILKDKEYLDLFEYIGIDTAKLEADEGSGAAGSEAADGDDDKPDEAFGRIILYNGKEGKTEVLTDPVSEGFEYDSVIGKLSFAKLDGGIYFTENDFSVVVDGLHCYDTLDVYEPAIRFFFINEDGPRTMELTKDYELDVMVSTFNDMKLYLKALKQFDYEIVMEYSSEDFLQDREISAAVENLGEKLDIIKNDDLSGVSFSVTDAVTGELIDSVYYEYVMDNKNGINKCRIVNCVR